MSQHEIPANLAPVAFVGIALGVVGARFLRRRGLRCSWPLLLAPLAAAWWPLDKDVAALVGTALLSAVFVGGRQHLDDLHAGGDLAQDADARFGPADALRCYLAGRAARAGRVFSPAGLLVGVGDRRGVRIPLATHGGSHTLVVGATGAGKTVTQAWIATHLIGAGHSAVAVDPKGDNSLRHALAAAAADAGREFVEWSPEGPSVYNPYARGSDTEIVDKLLAAETYTEPHYLRQAQRFLGHVIRGLRATGTPLSLPAIVGHFDIAALEAVSRLMNGEGGELQRYIDSLTPTQIGQLTGTRDRLAILSESDLGPWLTPDGKRLELDLVDVVAAGDIAYFALHADRRPLAAQMLGAAIVQDLVTLAAQHQGAGPPAVILLDEFSALAAEQVVRLFGRGRSAGMSLILGTQELADLTATTNGMLERVLGNVETVIAHRQNVPSSAELVAAVAGTHGAWSLTRRVDHLGNRPDGTRTRSRQFALHPDHIKRLPRGHAAVIVPARGEAHFATMFAPRNYL